MRIIDGNIFEAMRLVLPEHRELMDRMKRESGKKEQPLLAQDELEEMQYLLSEALEGQVPLRATLFHPYGHQIVTGIPFVSAGQLFLQTADGKRSIPFDQLIRLAYPVDYD
ncbi:MAG: YolD [Bacilli bacterium]|nr:YolD [Bacilli bacterium]